jgi:hypothetical protein
MAGRNDYGGKSARCGTIAAWTLRSRSSLMAASSLSCRSSRVPSRPTTHRNANGAQAGSEFRLGNAWTRHHDFAGAGEGDITRPTLHRVARLDRLRHVVGLVAPVLRSFERPISAISVGILRPHFGLQVVEGLVPGRGDLWPRLGSVKAATLNPDPAMTPPLPAPPDILLYQRRDVVEHPFGTIK